MKRNTFAARYVRITARRFGKPISYIWRGRFSSARDPLALAKLLFPNSLLPPSRCQYEAKTRELTFRVFTSVGVYFVSVVQEHRARVIARQGQFRRGVAKRRRDALQTAVVTGELGAGGLVLVAARNALAKRGLRKDAKKKATAASSEKKHTEKKKRANPSKTGR